jgi:hypothetical protein
METKNQGTNDKEVAGWSFYTQKIDPAEPRSLLGMLNSS